VHIAGLITPKIAEIMKICREHKLILIEDCAHAPGAIYKGKKAGSFGFAGCFSFYPTKIITTGAGGMITTNNKKLNLFAKSLRFHGTGKNLSNIVNYGNDWFLDEFRCAIGLFQLRELEGLLKARKKIADEYIKLLENQKKICCYIPPNYIRHSYYKFPLTINGSVDINRLKKIISLKWGFELESVYNPPCHLQPIYKGSGRFPVAEDLLSRQVTLPIHPLLRRKEIRYIVRAMNETLRTL